MGAFRLPFRTFLLVVLICFADCFRSFSFHHHRPAGSPARMSLSSTMQPSGDCNLANANKYIIISGVERAAYFAELANPLLPGPIFPAGACPLQGTALHAAEDFNPQSVSSDMLTDNSLFVWFSDRLLSEEQETLRKQARLNLMLLPPGGANDDKNLRLVKLLLPKWLLTEQRKAAVVEAGMWSHFLSLTLPDIESNVHLLPELRIGVDAFELRVDFLADRSAHNVHAQLAHLRAACPLPVVYTVRTKGQLGQYPDEDVQGIEELLMEGLRAGVEWIDVEASLPQPLQHKLKQLVQTNLRYQNTRVIGSVHSANPQSESDLEGLFHSASSQGWADIAKVVVGTSSPKDCDAIHRVAESILDIPYIGLCLGKDGERSRVLNKRFTPVTHPLLTEAAPGQLSAQELQKRRQEEGLLAPMQYYLFGKPIQQSLSPKMHNSAFQTLLLPYTYSLAERDNVEEYGSIINSPTFGGASVTIPYKEVIIPDYRDYDRNALSVGAVNTIVPTKNRRMVGYNTDWQGIHTPIERLLQRTKPNLSQHATALVIGAGTVQS